MSKIYEELNKNNWCKGSFAATVNGEWADENGEKAVKWCALGWMHKKYLKGRTTENWQDYFKNYVVKLDAALDELPKPSPSVMSVTDYNDHPLTTLDMIIELFKRADL